MKDTNLFHYDDYKKYLGAVLSPVGEGRGQRSKLALAIGCQTAFVSQVLKQKTHFSPEHGILISKFLGHTETENEYFLILIHLGRAGTPALRAHYEEQIKKIREKIQNISERLQVKQSLSESDQAIYYSASYYVAIHVLISIPHFQNKEALAKHLKLSPKKISECLEFLVHTGLALEKQGRYTVGETRLHLPANSPLISKHHTNWRMKAVQALENFNPDDSLHYSAAISLSEADVKKIRTVLLDAIERVENIFKPSKEETAFVVALDLFPL